MTKQLPRVYTYKITFEEVPYYYYGVHKEKKFNEKYMGSPIANKWAWDFYTPKKQILELFNYNDEGYIEAQEVEKRLIKPVYNIDPWCLNASCGGNFSLDICKKGGKKIYEEGIGIHGMTSEELFEARKKGGKKAYEEGIGIHGMTSEGLFEARKKAAREQHAQKWQCTETRYISTPCGLSAYQKARGIDTSNRIRVQ
jgi:hypothetical protein